MLLANCKYIVNEVSAMIAWGWVILLCWISFILGMVLMGMLNAAGRELDESPENGPDPIASHPLEKP
jgi:UPF0716 family protein affecting phage T7 exclusion